MGEFLNLNDASLARASVSATDPRSGATRRDRVLPGAAKRPHRLVGNHSSSRLEPGPALLGIALLIALLTRLALILGSDFPLKDGGLFVTMARDIRDAGLSLPMYSTFNAGDIPFAYPPLGLYLLALVPGDPIATERWLPLVWSMLAIPGAYLLARELVGGRLAGLATLLFSLMPITWAIEGAGVTRALAFALLLWSVWAVARLLRVPSAKGAAAVALLTAGAALSHPAVGPTWIVTVGMLVVLRPSRRGLALLASATVVGGLLIAPWLAIVISRYGLSSVVAAGQAHHLSETLGRLLTAGPSYIGILDLVFPLAIVGISVRLAQRQWILPVWLCLLILVPGGEGRYAAIAWAVLAAIGAATVASSLRPLRAERIAAALAVALLFFGSTASAFQRFGSLPLQVRETMAEAGRAVPAGTRFAVYSDDPSLEQPILDWFPTLSGRISVGTFMGLEWTSVERWDETVAIHHQIQLGNVPPGTDAVFRVEQGAATWHLVASGD